VLTVILDLRYFDTITLKHKDTKVFLHSHPERYPLRYDDGRISSQGMASIAITCAMHISNDSLGQQVTGYGHPDENNWWQIVPTKALPETGRGRVVRHNDIIQLLHVTTQTYLLTHDVASPLMPTNQEFTTWSKDDLSRYNDTLFQVTLNGAHEGEAVRSKSGYLRLVHVPTRVSLWSHRDQLPDWAFKQQEVNGDKSPLDRGNIWYVDEVISGEGASLHLCFFHYLNELRQMARMCRLEITRNRRQLPSPSVSSVNSLNSNFSCCSTMPA
jgi:dolichyl-phosphate-mannose-protein mannosyltransferase